MTSLNWTSKDLELLPDNEKRYEIIDGELYISKQPHWYHQLVCSQLWGVLQAWSNQTKLGMANVAPGVILDDNNDVAPDVVWITRQRLAKALDEGGHLTIAPELVIEVLSPGKANQERDREVKLNLYSRRGVGEYWIVSWMQRFVEVYRREDAALKLVATLHDTDTLTSPLLPGFSCPIGNLFFQESLT